jgi:hypothetical protein
VSTTNTYYIKSAADDTRAAMAKLERLVIGNGGVTSEIGNEVTTIPQKPQLDPVNALFTVV